MSEHKGQAKGRGSCTGAWALGVAVVASLLMAAGCGANYSGGDDDNNGRNNGNNSANNANNNGNNSVNNGGNNGSGDPCAALDPTACERDPRCVLDNVSVPCPDGEECPAIAQVVCVSLGCLDDSECPSGHYCGFGASTAEEKRPAPGPDGEGDAAPIIETGYCYPYSTECYADADCGPNQVCQLPFGAPCGPEDCGGDIAPAGVCVDITPDCFSDADCRPNQFCSFAQSVPCYCPPCEEGQDCGPCDCGDGDAARPANGVCIDRAYECWSDLDCGAGFTCQIDEDGIVGDDGMQDCACEPCADGEACEPCDCGTGLVAPGGWCVPNPDGFECYSDEDCGFRAYCRFYAECDDPNGFTCQETSACLPYNDDCSDDTGNAICEIVPPDCERGTVLVPRNGCWACVDPESCREVPQGGGCDDGQPVLCDALPPECEPGLIVAAQNGCWACVDPNTCAPPQDACWGAWIDESGVCRAPNDGIYPAACCEDLPDDCGALQSEDACSAVSGCFWWTCPDDVDCALGTQCIAARRLDTAPGTIEDTCGPADGPAYRIVVADQPLACHEQTPMTEVRVEVYAWDIGLSELQSGFGYTLRNAWISACLGGVCEEGAQGVFYVESIDASDPAATAHGTLLIYLSSGAFVVPVEAATCPRLGFCG